MEKYGKDRGQILNSTPTQLFYMMRKAVEQTKEIKDQLAKPRSQGY